MILNDNSTQQINTLVIQLQNKITNLTNEFRKLNNNINDLDSEISDLEKRISSNENDADNNIDDLDSKISDLERRVSSNENDAAAMNTEILANTEAISGKADKSHTHTKSQITDFPTSLPANGGTADKATSDANGNNIVDTYATKTELVKAVPSYGAADAGKALTVSSGGTGTEWHRLIKYHDIACGNVTIPSSGYVEFNSYLEGNDVPISAVIYRWATNTGAFYVTAYAGNPKLFYVVGTPGVVVMELTVRIFCVDKFALEG